RDAGAAGRLDDGGRGAVPDVDVDSLLGGHAHLLDHVVGLDGELAAPTVDQHGELDALWPAVVQDGVEGGSNRAAGEQDVVHQDDAAPRDRDRELGRADARVGQGGRRVVAVQGDVDGAEGDRALELPQVLREDLGDGHAAAADADQQQVFDSAVTLDDLPGDPPESAERVRAVQEGAHGAAGEHVDLDRPN